jgi:hypothetical protein
VLVLVPLGAKITLPPADETAMFPKFKAIFFTIESGVIEIKSP